MKKNNEVLGFETLALHAGQTVDSDTRARAVPIYQTTSYVFKDTAHAARLFALQEAGNIYTRLMNPTTDVLEKRVAALEGGVAAVAASSGMAATMSAILNIARSGDNIVSTSGLYGGTYNLFYYTLPKMGITVKILDSDDPKEYARSIDEHTRCLYLESIGNPRLTVPDFEAIAEVAHRAGIPVMVDNTATTPYLLRPFDYGCDIVVHSLTKFLGGHGTSIGGIVVDSGKFDWTGGTFPDLVEPDPSYHGVSYVEAFKEAAFAAKLRVQVIRDCGGCISPFNAFLVLLGIETLPLRMARHCENALAVAEYLASHKNVSWVNYPTLGDHPSKDMIVKYMPRGCGALLGFGIKGGLEAGTRFIDSLKLVSHLANIGDAKTLAIHPASTTHQQLTKEQRLQTGVTEDFIRLSVGLETIDDILADLDQALKS